MIIYCTDDKGRYNGRTAEAAENPMYNQDTHADIDKWLYNPRTESITEPPSVADGQVALLTNGTWVVVQDLTGMEYYTPDGTKHVITYPGVDIPAGCLTFGPPSKYHTTHDSFEWIEDEDLKKVCTKADLAIIDSKSIRAMREFLVSKFGDEPDLPEFLKTYETQAIEKRGEL